MIFQNTSLSVKKDRRRNCTHLIEYMNIFYKISCLNMCDISIQKKKEQYFFISLTLSFIYRSKIILYFNFAFHIFPKDFKLIKMHEQVIFKTDPLVARTLWISVSAFIKRIDKLLTYCKYWICRLIIFFITDLTMNFKFIFYWNRGNNHFKIMFLLLMKKKKTVRFQDIICITNKFYIIIIVQFVPSLINSIFNVNSC